MLAFSGDDLVAQPEPECPLRVQLPQELRNFFDEAGYIGTIVGEQRSSARLRVRCEAVLESIYAPPFVSRAERRARILVKDLSRCGIGILHHQQLFPTEKLAIELHQRRLHVTVVRCRKLGDSCFEVGARIEAIDGR